MKKTNILILGLVLALSVLGCGQKPAANSQAAIESSKSLATVDEQAKYLVGQANAFVNSKQYDQAVATAQYVLANLDANSAEAKRILEKAKADMVKAAEGAVNDMKNKMQDLGK